MLPARTRTSAPWLVAGLLLLLSPPAQAGAPSVTPAPRVSSLYAALFPHASGPHGASGLRAPVTDEFPAPVIPLTIEDALGPQVPVEALFEVQLPDGSWMMDLQGTGQHFMMADPDPLAFPRRFFCTDQSHGHGLPLPAAPAWSAPTTLPVVYAER